MHYAIIAAGEGSRLAQEGATKPKPLITLDGRPMVKRLIDIFVRCHAQSVSIIVNERMPEVRQYLASLELPVPFHVMARTTPGSLHSFYELSKAIPEGKLCLATVDSVFREYDFKQYVDAFEHDETHDGLWAITPFIDDEKPLYVEVDDSMHITAFSDKTPKHSTLYVSGGIYAMSHCPHKLLERCLSLGMTSMRDFQRALVDAGWRLKAHAIDKIIDVDHAADIITAQQFISLR